MFAVVFIALAVPVAMVLFSVSAMTRGKSGSPPNPEADAALEKGLADIAAQNLAPAALSEGQARVEIIADDAEAESARIQKLLNDYEAAALPAARKGNSISLLAAIPESRVAAFTKACRNEKETGEEPAIRIDQTRDQARTLVEIVITEKSAP